MDGAELLPKEIAEALERGATVVTGNQRAARTLRRAYRPAQQDTGARRAGNRRRFWHGTHGRLSCGRGLLIDGHASRLLLNRTQEHAVWRSILEAGCRTKQPALHRLAGGDGRRGMAAVVPLSAARGDCRAAATSSDTRAFQRWANAFQRRCREEGLPRTGRSWRRRCE